MDHDDGSGSDEIRLWVETPAVLAVFDALRRETLAVQKKGYLGLPDNLSPRQVNVLRANLGRMPSREGGASLGDRADHIVAGMLRDAQPEWAEHAWILHGRDGLNDPLRAEDDCRSYPVAQALAMDAGAWPDPARALLYTGFQHALHMAFRDSFDREEPNITEKLLSKIEQTFEGRVFEPLRIQSVPMPGARALDLGWASMQEGHDMLAAVLAIAIGMRICGREMYRVVLLQAKNAKDDGRFDVSSRQPNEQIDKFLSTGMGWFAFYPDVKRWNPFAVTVRPATEIFRDVFAGRDTPRYRGAFDVEGHENPAWDLGLFVASYMTSQELGLGRLFPDVESAAEALSVERERPLARAVLAADLTGALGAHKLVAELGRRGYVNGRAISAPRNRHGRPAPGDGPSRRPGRKG